MESQSLADHRLSRCLDVCWEEKLVDWERGEVVVDKWSSSALQSSSPFITADATWRRLRTLNNEKITSFLMRYRLLIHQQSAAKSEHGCHHTYIGQSSVNQKKTKLSSKSVLASTRLEDPSKKGTSPNRRGRPNRHKSFPAPRERGLIQPFFR